MEDRRRIREEVAVGVEVGADRLVEVEGEEEVAHLAVEEAEVVDVELHRCTPASDNY